MRTMKITIIHGNAIRNIRWYLIIINVVDNKTKATKKKKGHKLFNNYNEAAGSQIVNCKRIICFAHGNLLNFCNCQPISLAIEYEKRNTNKKILFMLK